eukprot:gene7432-8254_t
MAASVPVVGKKLINSPENAVDDCLEGLCLLNNNVVLMRKQKVILRRDVHKLKEDGKVCLISGGGSGHEPAHAGYVGKGMLTAAVCGNVFASPPTSSVLAAIEACAGPAGVLLIVTNYTGDRLNFGKAAEIAKGRGVRVEMVIVAEDCALTSKDKSAGRRGLCGTVFVSKIAGAMAESGTCLNEIVKAVNHVKQSMGTMGLSLSPCSLPGQAPAFDIPKDAVEFGLGIHGEAGIKRIELAPAKDLIKQMINHLLHSEYMPDLKEMKKPLAIIVNNLGGTSNLEMNIVTGEIIKQLHLDGLVIERCYVGTLMTSLEMAGVSLTVLACNQDMLKHLDAETAVNAWPKTGTISDSGTVFLPDKKMDQVDFKACKIETQMSKDIAAGLSNICHILIENKDWLNELDRESGDADCGTTFARGAVAIKECLSVSQAESSLPTDSPSDLAMALANLLESSMGGTSGAILSLFLTASAKSFKDETSNKAFVKALFDGMEAIKFYGGADEGDRTLLDALAPAARAFQENITKGFPNAIKAAAEAACCGAERTTSMIAAAGRSSYVGAGSFHGPDPGAVAISLIFDAISNSSH